MRSLVLLKIGGSLITDKTKPLTVRDSEMRVSAEGIELAVRKNPDLAFVVANGAGSFGHYLASKETGSNPQERIDAIHESVVLLNKLFVQTLVARDVPAETVVPAEIITAEHGVLKDIDMTEIEDLLSINSIPVLFGDIVSDGTAKGMIFSTEALFEILAEKFRTEYELRVIFAGETEGVLDEEGNVIPEISSVSWKSMGSVIKAPKGYDVTGGMLQKVESALRIASIAESVYIISGKDPDNIARALRDARIGTRIRP